MWRRNLKADIQGGINLNSVNLIGRLTRDPQLRYLPTGMAVARFNLAVDKDLSKDKRKELESKGQATADFINIVVWGKQAENCANYLVKGRLIGIQGRLQSGSYDKDGVKVYTIDVVAERVQFLEWGDRNKQENILDGFYPTDDDDMPF